MARLAPWLAVALLVAVALALAAPGAQGDVDAAARPTPYDVQLELGPFYFNPSIVHHGGVYLSTARTAHMKRIDRTNWWFNDAYICMSTAPTFETVSCRKFDPWQGRFQECLWGSERRVADVDTEGLEDPKLFTWPGKGVFAVFGRKPEALGASPYCRDPVFVQFIVQVVALDKSDPWSIRRPRELKPGPFAGSLYQPRGEPIKEKNWMPFVRGDQLYMVHSVVPHRVFRMSPQGVAVQQFLTTNEPLLAPFAGQDVHGGPPVVLMGGAEPYYLGIFHFFMTFGSGSAKVKQYHHYFYKTEAVPPFRICAVSQELPLVTRKRDDASGKRDWTHQRIWKDTSQTAYASGLYVDGDRVLVSYGSSDIDARLLALGVADVEAMFQQPFDCSGARVLDGGSGEPLPAGGAAGGGDASGGWEKPQRWQHRRAHQNGGA
ncbi:hypothetical protein Rsub_12425 [Raphidocelis subcapitata]|uniref:Uncharacterized protein n=1 Tax=Raphidocelis subcapitata TaxID=307507 RepID=A0A2V0PNN3_9CHLO|nr:hypothetical protein Rsub_12425 [Raphidocelis subcapitata]|eukprot:GBF99713.1 hypothetical protein Rsub_12425 [Raphidocelis subcapitata]